MHEDDLTFVALIPAHNEARTIGRTIRGLRMQSRPPIKIYVIDDGSTDGTGKIARGLGAIVLRREKSSGKKSDALNAALPFVDTKLFLMTDADTELHPNACELLLSEFASNNPPTASYGCVVSRKPRRVHQRGRAIEVRFQQFFTKRAQDHRNATLVAPGCIAMWQTSAIHKRKNGLAAETLAEDMEHTTWVETHPELFPDDGNGRVTFAYDALAFTEDPPTFRLYWQQTMRWYASFFQNLRVNWRSLFLPPRGRLLPRNTWLTFFVLGYLLDGIVGFALFFALPIVAVALRWQWDWSFFLLTVAGFIIVRTAFVGICSLMEGVRLSRLVGDSSMLAVALRIVLSPKETILSLPCYLFWTDLLNKVIWPLALIRELPPLNKRFSVSTWKKGH